MLDVSVDEVIENLVQVLMMAFFCFNTYTSNYKLALELSSIHRDQVVTDSRKPTSELASFLGLFYVSPSFAFLHFTLFPFYWMFLKGHMLAFMCIINIAGTLKSPFLTLI